MFSPARAGTERSNDPDGGRGLESRRRPVTAGSGPGIASGRATDRSPSGASGRRRSADAERGVPVGVLFEISIVCHVLCSWFWRTVGVSPVLGVVLVVRLVFLVLGFGVVCLSCSSWFFCAVVRGCGGRVAGGSGSGGRCGAPGSSSCDGWGVGRAGPGCRECFAGVGLRPVLLRLVGGGGGGRIFFRPALLVFFWFPVLVFVVLSGLGVWGVSGWVGVFSPASVVRPGPVPVLAWLRGLVLVVGCSGFVWRV